MSLPGAVTLGRFFCRRPRERAKQRERAALRQRLESRRERKGPATHVVHVDLLGRAVLGVGRVDGDVELVAGGDLDVGVVGHEAGADLGALGVEGDGEGAASGIGWESEGDDAGRAQVEGRQNRKGMLRRTSRRATLASATRPEMGARDSPATAARALSMTDW